MNFVKLVKLKLYLYKRELETSFVFSDILRYKRPTVNLLVLFFFISLSLLIVVVTKDFYSNITKINLSSSNSQIVSSSKKKVLFKGKSEYSNYKCEMITPNIKKTGFVKNIYTPKINDSLLLKTSRILLIDKENEKIFLCYFNKYYDKWMIGRYQCVGFGRVFGPKDKINDGKSPEGIYFVIDKRNKPLSVLGVYGPKAFVTNYPNHIDRSLNRTGYGIWIHGVELDSGCRPSHGCFTLDNRFITYLDRFVKNMTPIFIVSHIDKSLDLMFDKKVLENEKKFAEKDYNFLHYSIIKLIDGWASAWSSRDIKKYMTYYSKNMFARNMNYDTWKIYKNRIFTHNDSIYVHATDITPISIKSDSVTVEFLQHYWAKNLEQIGMKRFLLIKENGKWKIVDEIVVRTIS